MLRKVRLLAYYAKVNHLTLELLSVIIMIRAREHGQVTVYAYYKLIKTVGL